MRLKCIKVFNDVKAGVWRMPGDEWEADEPRLAELTGTPWGDFAVEAERPKAKPEPRRAKPPRKAE